MSRRRHHPPAQVDRGARRVLARLTVAAVAVTLPSLPALGLAGAAPVGAAPHSYVSLGDSYTSGPFIPNQSVTQPPLGCLQSDHNYPHLAAAALHLSLTDVSCSGATTEDMWSPQSTSVGTNPPQLSAVSSSTSVVTLGIGGNDIHFVNIIQNCAALTPFGPTRVGWTCQSFYDSNGNDQIAAAIAATGPKVTAILQEIHKRAPTAKVLVVGYPAILPPHGHGCWPQMPLTYSDVGYLRDKELQLNAMLANEAAADGDTFVETYQPSESFNACTPPGPRWIEPVVPVSPAAPVHPNAVGEAGMAGLVESKMAP